MKIKKETKIQELERRITNLENAIRYIPIKIGDPSYPTLQQNYYWCQYCGGWTNHCPGHNISSGYKN